MNIPILYSFRRCPYAMRARLALLHAGIQCELREVLLKDKPADMLALSNKATVPVLLLPDATVLDESLDIMRWAVAQRMPKECFDAQNLALIAMNDTEFKYHLDRYKYPQRFDEVGDAQKHFHLAAAFLEVLDKSLMQSTCLKSESASMLDAAIFPFVRQFAAVDRVVFEQLGFVYVQQWLHARLAESGFQTIMRKFKPWCAGDKPVLLY